MKLLKRRRSHVYKCNKILEYAKYHHLLRIRFVLVNDLIASEGKYHPNCYKWFLKNSTKVTQDLQTSDLPTIWLCSELRLASEKGHVLELSEVFTRYCTLSNEASVPVPQSYFTRMHTVQQKLFAYVDTIYDLIVMPGSEKQTLLVPNKRRHIPVSEMVDAKLNDDSFDIPSYRPKEDDFLSMVHAALKLRSDILAHPS